MKVWVFLVASLVLALVLLGIEIGLLGLVVDTGHINSTLYDLAIFPSWALNAFPAGYILRLFGLRVSRRVAGGEACRDIFSSGAAGAMTYPRSEQAFFLLSVFPKFL